MCALTCNQAEGIRRLTQGGRRRSSGCEALFIWEYPESAPGGCPKSFRRPTRFALAFPITQQLSIVPVNVAADAIEFARSVRCSIHSTCVFHRESRLRYNLRQIYARTSRRSMDCPDSSLRYPLAARGTMLGRSAGPPFARCREYSRVVSMCKAICPLSKAPQGF